jgi:hypothetical protein
VSSTEYDSSLDKADENFIRDENGFSPAPVRGLGIGGAQGSILDIFRQEQAELASAKSVLIPIAGYEKIGLKVQYRMPYDGKELDVIGRHAQKTIKDPYERNLAIATDTMVKLCEGIYCQPEGVEEPVMFDPMETGQACRFGPELAEALDVDVNSAREVVQILFGNKDLAIIAHVEKLSRWLANSNADLESEIWELGE